MVRHSFTRKKSRKDATVNFDTDCTQQFPQGGEKQLEVTFLLPESKFKYQFYLQKACSATMKFSPVITPRGALRFVAVLVVCNAIFVHIAAKHESVEGTHRDDPQTDPVSSDGAETGEKQPSLLHRARRSVKKNATPTLPDIVKRLQALEKR